MKVPGSFRVEFLGPPGVGKSTLYQALLPRLEKTPGIIGAPDLAPRAALSASRRTGLRKAMEHFRAEYAPAFIREPYRQRLEARIAPQAEHAVAAMENIDGFLAICFQALARQDDGTLRVKRAKWLVNGLRQAALADMIYGRELVVFDELLCQSGFGLGLHDAASGDAWRDYFAVVPAPRAVVAPNGSERVTVERLSQRESPGSRHLETIEAGARFREIALETLDRRGVEIYEPSTDLSRTDAEALLTWLQGQTEPRFTNAPAE